MKKLLRQFIFNEAISLNLNEITDIQGTKWAINVYTLDEQQRAEKLVSEEYFAIKDSALTVFQNKYNCLLGVIE